MLHRDSLFLPDLDAFFQEHQRSPHRVRLVSIEPDGDRLADAFWSHPTLHATLAPMARVLRIKAQRQQRLLRDFHARYAISVLPSLFIFPPFSESPSEVIAGTFPDADEFGAVMLSLEAPAPAPAPAPAAAPAPAPASVRDRPIDTVKVSVRQLNGEIAVKEFRAADHASQIFTWACRITHMPFGKFDLVVVPGETAFTLNERLAAFAPELNLKVVMRAAPSPPPELVAAAPRPPPGRAAAAPRPPPEQAATAPPVAPRAKAMPMVLPAWLQQLWGYVKDLSFIGDDGGDPLDFWHH